MVCYQEFVAGAIITNILSLFHKISVVEYSQYFEYLEITKKGGGTHGGQYVGRKDVVCVLQFGREGNG